MKFDKYVILEKRDDFNDKKTVNECIQMLTKVLAGVRKKYGKTYNKDVGMAMEHTVYQIEKLIEEWKQIEL